MTPKEKATELVNKFIPHTRVFHESFGWEDYQDSAKQCALIAVDEILESQPSYEYWKTYDDETPSAITYWNEVKNEINKI